MTFPSFHQAISQLLLLIVPHLGVTNLHTVYSILIYVSIRLFVRLAPTPTNRTRIRDKQETRRLQISTKIHTLVSINPWWSSPTPFPAIHTPPSTARMWISKISVDYATIATLITESLNFFQTMRTS